MMPEMDGVDVCARFRRNLPLANAYLMLLTSLESRPTWWPGSTQARTII